MNNRTDNKDAFWMAACRVEDVPADGGVCVKFHDTQIALYHFTRRNEWYAAQNMCPHRKQMALSRGMLGTQNGEPKVACPFHKKTFSLVNGRCMNSDEGFVINTYPVKVENAMVYILLNESELIQANCSTTSCEK